MIKLSKIYTEVDWSKFPMSSDPPHVLDPQYKQKTAARKKALGGQESQPPAASAGAQPVGMPSIADVRRSPARVIGNFDNFMHYDEPRAEDFKDLISAGESMRSNPYDYVFFEFPTAPLASASENYIAARIESPTYSKKFPIFFYDSDSDLWVWRKEDVSDFSRKFPGL